jgi:molybdate transport system ATP-binding protein
MLSVSIKKNYGKFNLDVSFEAGREVLALLGVSGSGKSTALRCIAGIDKPDEGRIVLNGRVLFDSGLKINLPPQKRRVAYMFQQYALFPNMTVAQNIAAGVRKEDRANRRAIVEEKIAMLRLEGQKDKYPRHLSGGQQQRVALARILANEPELLLLDEPFSALDSYLKWQLELEFADILTAYSGPTVFVSHNRREVYRLCDSVCVLNEGRSEAKSSVRGLFETPATLSACLLSGCRNFSRIHRISENHVKALDWGTVLKVSQPIHENSAYLGVRSHSLAHAAQAGENNIQCKVERIIDNVYTALVILGTPGDNTEYSRLCMEINKTDCMAFKEGDKIFIHIDPDNIMLLSK